RRVAMFPTRRGISGNAWQCPWCGTAFKDGDVCPHDSEHWSEFSAAVRKTARPEPVAAGKRGVA
ncbi:MAG: hypothetical protein ACRDKW_02230, partial [Actinomycetota bacterium]